MLLRSPLSYAIEVIVKAKIEVNNEYIWSMIDLMEANGNLHFTVMGSFIISDIKKVRLRDVDFGWGKEVYGGPAIAGVGAVQKVITFFISYQNNYGVEGKLVPICLASHAMQTFKLELALAMENKDPPFIRASI
ncbi:hypothetical protein SUGI_0247860 [Cryptomeria japonica]|nr:hypothetical protein SUGI_0247860 [Cryptomeria japonica]